MSDQKFDSWTIQKKQLQTIDHTGIVFSEREIWWCALGKNIGDEQDGKNELFERPVLILRKFSKHTALVAPLTTMGKIDLPFYHKLASDEESFLILSQVRLISTKRLLRKIYKLGRGEFNIAKEKLKSLIFGTKSKPA